MFAKISYPTKSAMQSGASNNKWILEVIPDKNYMKIDDVAGWHSVSDTKYQILIEFETVEQAEDYAKRNGYNYEIIKPNIRKIVKKSYSDNFK